MEQVHIDHNINAIQKLAAEYHQENLCLFIGSGVSKGCGLPDWKELTDDLLCAYFDRDFGDWRQPKGWGQQWAAANAVKETLQASSNPVISRYIRLRLDEDYIKAVRSVLYDRPHKVSEALRSIASMGSLAAVCSYNYDDLLERLSNDHPSFRAIASPSDPIHTNSIPVYHVHGLLPEDPMVPTRGDLVLSEEDYHRVYSDAYHWSNTVQLTLLRQHTSILIGLSVDDPNLRRILDIVQREGAYGSRYVMLRIPPRVFKGIFNTVYWTVTSLFERAMEALGLHVIWLREFDEIPIILSAVQTKHSADEYVRNLPADRIGYRQLASEEEKGDDNDRSCQN